MEEDTEFKKLPVEERCVHKLWKARVDGYEEAIKIFREIDDEKSSEWNKFVNIIKKMVVDSNAMAQEKGLEATLLFVENCSNASKTCTDVVPGIIGKCIAAPKAKTRDISVQIILMYIEIEKQEIVIEEMIKGLDHKNPRIVAACIAAITLALHEFGHKVIGVKPIIKKISQLLSDRDKGVRDEGKRLTIEIYRWIGAALQSQLTALPAVLLTELETEFVKVKGEKPEPNRYLKSQQEKRKIVEAAAAAAAANGDDNGGNADDSMGGPDDEIDPMDLIEPVDILSQLPKDFYEKLEAKKWQERKESLEALETLLIKNPKLESGDYGDVVRALKKVLTKDTNVLLVALAGKCMALLAKGLAKRYSPYANVCVPAILEKFKEKKTNVVVALREAIDAILPSTSLEGIQEDLLEALNNKNPNIKAETASFFARSFTKTVPTLINKKLLKLFTGALIKTLNESDPTVRDASADAIGTLLKLMGEKIVGPFLTDVDPLKMAKIKECSEKAIIIVKIPTNKKDRPATAPPVKSAAAIRGGGGSSTESKSTTTRPTTATIGKKPIIKKTITTSGGSGGGGGLGGGISKSGSSAKILPSERDMSIEEIDEKAIEILPPDIINGLCDGNWKTRVSSAESFIIALDTLENSSGLSQILLRSICKKPGFKDMNFQVLKVKLDIVKKVIELFGVTTTTAEYLINDITEKLGDAKNSIGAANALTAIAETVSLEFVVGKIMNFSFEQQKSPKVQSEALNWVASAIKEFGFVINPKILLDDIKKAVQSTNPTVRQSAITLLGVMHLYMGNSLMMFFDNEKPALKQQIQTEFDKNSDHKPPAPIRGKIIGSNKMTDNDEMADPDDGNHQQQMINLCDSLPRIDISGQITESLLNEISDKNWKVKIEGLTKLQAILSEAKLIKPTIGDLPQTLALRLIDSNAKIAQTTLTICQQLAESMGTNCKQHVRVLFPGFLQDLGDGKPYIRAASIQCMNVWGDQCGYKEFFEGEMIADALKSGSPALRIELWAWLAEKLQVITPKTIMKEELTACLPYLFVNICDRNADVRKNANEAILGYMIHLGYDNMMKSLERLKSPSKKDIQAALDKVRPNLPVKPLPKSKQQAPIPDEIKKTIGGKNIKTMVNTNGIGGGSGGGSGNNTGSAPNSGGVLKGGVPLTSRKKDEEIDTSPLLSVNNTKNQRLIDEQKLKVLKWTFTQPREEFTDLLRDQMTTANINKSLMANMFHDDFRYHLKAIDSLNEDLSMNGKALICNLDLILKWISLRFYDTNPSVLLKGLDYLNLVFQMLIDTEYVLAENEGSCFIPHLLIKIGDPKDTVRNGVRALFRQICLIYPYTKVFAYIMEGLKSKNARQRTECLDELGYLIETYGLNVCQPTPQIALKEIARHISDRDNSVRSAALNCVVQAYFLTGEKVYKLIGNLNEKDLSMLDERIKRATKNRTKKVETKPNVVGGSGVTRSETIDTEDDIMIEDVPIQQHHHQHHSMMPADEPNISDHTSSPPPPALTLLTKPPKAKGPFGLNANILADIETGWIRSEQIPATEIISVDLSFLSTPLKIVEKNGVGYPTDRLQRLISMQPSMMPQHPNYTMSPPQPISALYSSKSTTNINVADALPKLDPNLVRIIRSIGNTDTITARAALNELSDILESPEKQAVLRDYEDLYVESIYSQIKNLSQIPINESLIMYQPVLSSTYDFFTSKSLGKNVSVESLKKLMSSLLGLMADHKLANNDEARYTKVINTICLRILDRTNFTNLNCALIRLLKETCSCAGLPKFTDLIMKCIWRNVKVMPEKSNELDYDAVLLEAHDFMVTLPSAWWAQRPSDTPSRTVRTIVHNMVKIKGNSILQHTSKIPQHSELRALLIRVLKNMQKDSTGGATTTTTTTGTAAPTTTTQGNVTSGFSGGTFNIRKPLIMPQTSSSSSKYVSNQIHEAMSHILSLISNKETAKEGLSNLYELKSQHPDLDISQFLKGANEFFLKFIDDGLAEIERSNNINNNINHNIKIEENNNNNNNIIHHHTSSNNDFKTKLEPDYWLNKLNSIRNPNAVTNIKEYNYNFENDRMTTHNQFYNQISKTSPTTQQQQQQQVAVDTIPTNREVLLQKLAQIRMQKNS